MSAVIKLAYVTTGIVAVLGASGCMVRAQGYAYADAPAAVVYEEAPVLVAIEPGIWVVEGAAEPVYYVDDAYWSFRGGVWYRTRTWGSAWARVEVHGVPARVVHRDHRAYAHYRRAPGSVVWRGGPGRRPHAGAHGNVPGYDRDGRR